MIGLLQLSITAKISCPRSENQGRAHGQRRGRGGYHGDPRDGPARDRAGPGRTLHRWLQGAAKARSPG